LYEKEKKREEKMNTQTESNAIESAAAGREEIFPLQERSCVQVAESVEEATEAVLAVGIASLSVKRCWQTISAVFFVEETGGRR